MDTRTTDERIKFETRGKLFCKRTLEIRNWKQ